MDHDNASEVATSSRVHAGSSASAPIPSIAPSQTALLVMHYQTDILGLFPSVAPELLANTRRLCDAARAAGVGVWFANLRFSPGYPEVSPLNKNGQGIKQLGLFINDGPSPELAKRPDEPLIFAHRASVFFGTDLQARLTARGVDMLIMVGIASTGVMLSSIAHASDADFRLYTVKDCCYDPDPIVHEHLFATAFESRTTVLSLADALRLLA
ncbi:cysteine hydrolase [Burkholderia sp. AU16741]|uniref:isochorismatase family cysteine hydrolase n=1 Tax=Burkholderia sp. AU16741 TaxID=2015347 RepID=UPI000B79D861|nr:isochorismatase family cysteine hydrolase [Burkholderia sp. AU16741]OXI30534.1 cysteine hydrolase [Burkholderia sp. AU16741]